MATYVLGPMAFPCYTWSNEYSSGTPAVGIYTGPSTFQLTAHIVNSTPYWVSGIVSGCGRYGTSAVFDGDAEHDHYGFVVESYEQATTRLGSSAGTTLVPANCNLPFGQEFFPLITVGSTSTTNKWQKFLAGGPTGATRLNIYSGSKPTNVDAITDLTAYNSNLLISFPIPAFATNNTTGFKFLNYDLGIYPRIGINSTYPEMEPLKMVLGICPTKTLSTGDGNATWFWFGNYSSPSNLDGISYLTGDVGLIGSGSDLEMADTMINSGNYYTSSGFNFTIPVYYSV